MRAWEKHLIGVPVARVPALVPGVLAAAVTVMISMKIAGFLGASLLRAQGIDPAGRASPISAISVAVILGILVSNVAPLPASLKPGFEFAVKKLLRLGIILVGIKLSLVDVAAKGLYGIPVVALVITTALVVSGRLARLLGVSARLGTLTAAATGICGVTATVATAPVIGADDREVAYTVANVTLFGVVAMLVYPFVAHLFFADVPESAGLFLGTAIHDTSQVMGAALSYREVYSAEIAFQVATVTKLTRNVFLVAVVPIVGVLAARAGARGAGGLQEGARSEADGRATAEGSAGKRPPLSQLFPLFVLGFLAMTAIRTAGDSAQLDPGTWTRVTKMLGETWATALLATAMASVGLSTDLRSLRTLGLRPLWLGAGAALLVGATGLVLAAFVGPAIR